jgi:hypothetical protein
MANNEKSTVDLAHLANSTREDRQGNGSNLEGEGLTAPPRTDATLMLRAQSDEPDPTDGKIIVAVSRKTLTEDLAALVTELNDLWAKACSRVSRPNVGWCKAGAVMWDQASIEVPPEWIGFIMSLKSVDANMARATMAAMFGAVATTVGPVDFDSILHALTTFVHAHPAFAGVTMDGEWNPPFGEDTVYCVSQLDLFDKNN